MVPDHVRAVGRSALAELIGTALLVATVIGTAIASARLTQDPAMQLFVNAFATGLVLVALILALSPVSAAFNPVVTLVERHFGAISTPVAVAHVLAQIAGAGIGALLAAGMFDSPLTWSTSSRTGSHLLLGEVVATFGLLVVVFGVVRTGRAPQVAFAVGGYIGAAYWFTSSTSFANPAVTLGRTLTTSAAGIAPASVLGFVAAQLVGGLIAVLAIRALYPQAPVLAADLTHLQDPA
jgi:arsenate reductase